jgi:hypothetical protein
MEFLHRSIPFLSLFCNCQLISIPLFPSSYPGRRASRNSTQFFSAELFFARTKQKTQSLYCWEGVFTAPLHENGSYSIAACVFIAAGIYLPSRCLVINIYSDFTIPAFGCHVAIYFSSYSFVKSFFREQRSVRKMPENFVSYE